MQHSSIVDRFLKYVSFDTQARDGAGRVPSSEGQLELGRYLAAELREIGLADAACDKRAYVTATLPGNCTDKKIPVVALIAHLDTAAEACGSGIHPRIVKYGGGDIVLNEALALRLSPKEFPELEKFKGGEIIVTDGTTLLGGDDKAGIAAIVEAVAWYASHPDSRHGTIKVVFTPDEEIGHGAVELDLERLGADFAYTIDAGDVGEFCWETFNGAKADVTTRGLSIHPGRATGIMKNAAQILAEFLSKLPRGERPDTTRDREGFFHLTKMSGDVERATATILIRDHDRKIFERRKERLLELAAAANDTYGAGCCEVEVHDQYYNMGDILLDRMHIVEYAKEAMRQEGVDPVEIAMRGGTDGSALSWRGLPAPNIFKGGMNGHGCMEYLPVASLNKCRDVVKRLIRVIAEQAG